MKLKDYTDQLSSQNYDVIQTLGTCRHLSTHPPATPNIDHSLTCSRNNVELSAVKGKNSMPCALEKTIHQGNSRFVTEH